MFSRSINCSSGPATAAAALRICSSPNTWRVTCSGQLDPIRGEGRRLTVGTHRPDAEGDCCRRAVEAHCVRATFGIPKAAAIQARTHIVYIFHLKAERQRTSMRPGREYKKLLMASSGGISFEPKLLVSTAQHSGRNAQRILGRNVWEERHHKVSNVQQRLAVCARAASVGISPKTLASRHITSRHKVVHKKTQNLAAPPENMHSLAC